MSKSLKKLIDINRLREFKNKLVGTGSAYVQTGEVDQTVGGTKTFPKPIVGSVTDSSGSCTGNAASATKLQTARTINGTSFDGTANITTANWGTARNISITDGTNTSTAVSVNGSANVSLNLPATIKATFVGNITGNVTGTATESLHVSRSVEAGGYADIVQTYQDDNNSYRSCTIRCTNGNGFNQILIGAHNESNSAPAGISVINTNGVVTADAPTPATSDNSTKIATTAFVKAQGYITGSGNTTGSSGSCTGNAATATKLAAKRTIALSGAATGTATNFDGSGNITIPVTALSSSAITSAITIYDLVPDGAANHRNFYRGKDITAAFNNGTVSANIANGTFRDIFPGDYITKSITVPQIRKADGKTEYIAKTTYNVRFIIADLDIWLDRGDPATTAHHVAIIPQSVVFNSVMNETNVTTGGYLGSFMHTHVMPAFATALQNAFGSAHILQFRFLDTNAVNDGLKSGGIVDFTGATYWGGRDWTSHYCHLMTEVMVYGAPITASCAADETMGGVQMAAFRLNSNLVYNRQNYWLSDVVSSASFARVGGGGSASAYDASTSFGVRPFALLR